MVTIGFSIGFAVAFLLALPFGMFIENVLHHKNRTNKVIKSTCTNWNSDNQSESHIESLKVNSSKMNFHNHCFIGNDGIPRYIFDAFGIPAMSDNAYLARRQFTSTGNSFGPSAANRGILGGYEITDGFGIEVINTNTILKSDHIIGHPVRIDDRIYKCGDIKYCDSKAQWPLLPGRRICIIVGKE